MNRTLQRSGALIGVLLGVLALAGPAQAQWTPKPYFSPNGGGADATAERIDAASESIDVAMYSISTSGPIWEALKRATARGIKVRVILNKGTSSNKHKAKSLEGIGCHVFSVSRTLHEKFALFDAGKWWKRKLLNGSANWSSGAEKRYSENTVLYGRHYHLFYSFQQEFNHLLSIARPASAGAEDHMQSVSLNKPSKRVRRYERAVFSSANSGGSTVIGDEIIGLMNSAQTSIEIDVAHFNSRSIADALIAIAQDPAKNLRIEVMVDLGEYADKKSRVTELEAAGIEVRYKTYSLSFDHPRSQLQHHKTLIVDGTNMVTGSFNWSDTAEQSNYENVIVIQGHVRKNKKFVKGFVDEHKRLWGQNRDRYDALMTAMRSKPGDADYRRYVPIHFDTDYYRGPLSLDRSQLRRLRSAGWAAGVFGTQPDGKRNVKFSYLDKESRDVFKGKPSGSFLPSNPQTGLSGALTTSGTPGQ
jgi:phosphatidylserine/phosphatidylglycerophosphate/cardiolipin synthase-like enzyme